MPEYDAFAPFYDLEHADFTSDIPFWLELAGQTGSPVCELACGTGRVLLPLARAGFDVTGLDLSQKMLDVLQSKLDRESHEVQGRVALIQADMKEFRFTTEFGLVFCAFNSFQHLMTTDDQLACLRCVREYLADDGLLCINVFAPFYHLLVNKTEHEQHLRKDPETGRDLITQYFTERDYSNQTMELRMAFDRTDENGLVRRDTVHVTLCWIHNREMHLLLRQAGFEVKDVFGDFDKRPYDYVSGRQIFVTRKA